MNISDNKTHQENNKKKIITAANLLSGAANFTVRKDLNWVRIICYHTVQVELEDHELWKPLGASMKSHNNLIYIYIFQPTYLLI